MEEPAKIQIVGHVNTNVPDAWRTRADYLQDQRRNTQLYYLQAGTLLVAVAGLLASSYFSYMASSEKQRVVVEVVHRHIQEYAPQEELEPKQETVAKGAGAVAPNHSFKADATPTAPLAAGRGARP